ncbi:bifunctional aminotransferase class I/II-fold pyridoxal phosphate-dependent enzyme/GNAT family N-acetyltransferase [Nannocystis sp. SCPEA4]|uniref:bifunctional aminotransferase class I/II-fold pyridoxal phosphate-dependent enzyme/GNAT family N-acetyltransferase n=1 Tax=Nannocystis sp. SCPEA4 TaxID=2996787 RepID=UPI002271C747|nr:bifunctional aminotransferase class I/II-fold pyridoxal phosphate-dependent enzyme/GNAT family N-acetyltransferase [Nannocystis sp. SCPEA4]MCY1061607.1 bifunctional aminotransferase class I/II-fold pyridoxal phosphate-dependent enzyme/GNAT family N-acetyltransferase [Nannocystis sp. SCPEA4]
MDASSFREAIFQVHSHGRDRGHYFLSAEDERFDDRHISVAGKRLLSFGSCSYLGLEFDPRLIDGGVEAYRRYGTQTSFSRGYLSCPLYPELEEDLLPRIFGVPRVLLLPSTSIAHHVVMPALLAENDAIVCDHQVHRSVDDAITLQCARSGADKVVVKHGELERALDVVGRLARTHHHVWFACDGVYSMYGDYLPAGFLHDLLAVAPNVRLFVDDAHGMSWAGDRGCGHLLSRFPLGERVVLVTSLAKAFATGGGVVVAQNRRLLETARLVGGPFSFSGPLRPGDLGASIASARIHLSPELAARQAALRARIEQANALCRTLGIPLVIENEAPIFFIALGRVEAVYLLAERLRDQGFHVNVSGFPAVPASRGGLRIAINAIHSEAQVDALFRAIAEHLPAVLAAVGVTRDEVEEQFAGVLPSFLRAARPLASAVQQIPERYPDALTVETHASIEQLDAGVWDAHVGDLSYIDARTMRAVERVFHGDHPRREHRWSFRYVLVRRSDEVFAAAPFTTVLMKDDTFMSAEVSAALERERLADPYLFTSRAVVMGTMASEGEHMFLAPGAERTAALVALAEAGIAEMKAQGCNTLVLRDLGDDPELVRVLTGQGFVPVPLLERYHVQLDWRGEDAFMAALASHGQRRHVRAVHEQAPLFDVELRDSRSAAADDELHRMYALYRRMAAKNLRINIFPLPQELLRAQLESGSWEFLLLRRRGGGPVIAWAAARPAGREYRALYCGVDYDDFRAGKINPYRQLLWQLVRRAGRLGCARLHLGMGARHEKTRFGAIASPALALVRADDAYQATRLQEFVTRTALRTSAGRS